MTITERRENTLYVSVWYAAGALLWTAGVYPIGNVMWHPATGALSGLLDSVFLWFYGHNLVGLLLTPLAIGAAYFVIPRVTSTPLYSHTLSLVGFWTLVALYSHIGGHHILQAPIPNWLKTVSVVDSMAMVVPGGHGAGEPVDDGARPGRRALGGPGGALRHRGHHLVPDRLHPGAHPVAAQRAEGHPLQQLGRRPRAHRGAGLQRLHRARRALAHPAAGGGPAALLAGSWSTCSSASSLFGLLGFFVVLTTAGLVQGEGWRNGELVYRVLPQIAVYMVLRAAFGVFIFSGAAIGLYNVVMTLRRGEPFTPQPLEEVSS